MQRNEVAGVANLPVTKLLPNTVGRFRIKSVTLDTVTMSENWMNNTVCVDRVPLVPGTARRNEGTNRNRGIASMKTAEMETEPTEIGTWQKKIIA